jgi:hypothetical protein
MAGGHLGQTKTYEQVSSRAVREPCMHRPTSMSGVPVCAGTRYHRELRRANLNPFFAGKSFELTTISVFTFGPMSSINRREPVVTTPDPTAI